MARNLIFMLIVLVVVWRQLKKDYIQGLAVCMGMFVSLPDYLRLSIGGGIPELTIHRLLLITLAIHWKSAVAKFRPLPPVPFFRGLLLFGAAQAVSLVLSVYASGSIKSVFVYVLEVMLLFYMVSTSLRSTEDVIRVLKGIAVGLACVAVLAFIERRWEFNWSRALILGEGTATIDIASTYPHRILLGYGMAIGAPIVFALADMEQQKRRKRLLWVAMLLLLATCYFSNSRGPWSGLIVCALLLFVMGSRIVKLAAVYIAILAMVVIATRPGIRDTIGYALINTFVEKDSLKADSYQYRWKLWHVAWSEICKSPDRFLFGYGGLSTETMDLASYFERQAGGTTAILGWTSWDNQWACDLIEFGVVGFAVEVSLFLAILWKMLGLARRSGEHDRNLTAGFLGACVTFGYAMTNVYIFAPQVKCLFWGLTACGLQYGRLRQLEASAAQAAPFSPSDGGRAAYAQGGPAPAFQTR
jgi:hypothetical protein